MIVSFTYTDFTLFSAVEYVKNLINSSTDLNFQQRSDCIDAIGQVPTGDLFANGYFEYTGNYGYRCQVTYNATQDYENNTVEAYLSLQINIDTPSESIATPTAASSAIPDPAPSLSAWVPGAAPTLPPIGALSANFSNINGVSVIIPASAANFDSVNKDVFLRNHIIGGYAQVSNPVSNYIKATVTKAGSGNIPDYTLAELYVNGVAATSGYSIGNRLNITLYTTLSADSIVNFVIYTQSALAAAAWIPETTMQCYGGVRFTNGSCRGYVVGASALGSLPKYDLTMTAGGAKTGTYVAQADMKSAIEPYTILNKGKNFHYSFNNSLSTNPVYGYIMPSKTFTGTGGTTTGNVYDVVMEATVTPDLAPQEIPLKIYTPYTFAVTGQPVWVQTVLPDSKVYTKITADWGDGTTSNYTTTTNTEFYFAHTYTSASNVPYTLIVTAQNNSGSKVATVSATRKFYIQEKYPVLDLENYTKTLGLDLTLPNTFDQVSIGSNEWVVADNINSTFNKLKENFDYLNVITDSIKKNTDFTLVEWLRDLAEYSNWNNDLTGSNTYFTASGAYTGVIPADTYVDFKSVRNKFAAPDFYNYFALSNGQIQIRKNNYNNTLVNQLTALTDNSEPLNIYGIDTNGTDLYVLASLNNSNNSKGYASVYRYPVGNGSARLTPTNQIGGSAGGREDTVNFNGSQPPSSIKVVNESVYIGDAGNRCIKVYNTALTYAKTIYTDVLSGYNVLQFDVDPSENIYVLGKLYAPNTPVITSVTLSADQYKITWCHDGERLNQTRSPSANFNIYGKTQSSSNYSLIDSIYSNYAALSTVGAPKLTTYVFSTSSTYDSFKIQAIGYDGVITSEQSSSKVIPNEVVFPSPYKVFVYDTNNKLLNIVSISEVPSTASIKKILIDPSGVFMYVLTSDYIYKYTTTGIYINRITSPSKTASSLGTIEDIVTGFIDVNHYFYVLTQKRVFKFTDIPITENVLNKYIDTLYMPNTGVAISSDEYIVDWVYNKALVPLLYNHELLAKSITKKYVVTLDGKDNLVDFRIRDLSSTELLESINVTDSNFIYSNEIVSSAVVNRTVERIYNIQETILNTLEPEVIRTTPSYLTNVLGRTTATTGNIVYRYVPTPTPSTTTTTTPAPLPVLFSFASACFTGNVYSSLYDGQSRYGDDFVATFSLINATTACNLILDIRDDSTGTALPDRVQVLVKQDGTIIESAFILNERVIKIPLKETLQTDSSTLQADGIKGTFGANFEVIITVGPITSTNNVKPRLTVTSSRGYLYNARFKNSVMHNTYPSSTLTVYELSGDTIPYAGIVNNTLGGYLKENDYIPHNWRIDGLLYATNPGINLVPKALSAVSLSAVRTVSGETELTFNLTRDSITAPEPPYYTIQINSTETYGGAAGANVGSGHAYGAGSYKAGSVVPIVAIAGYGSFGRWAFNTNVFRLSGVGTRNNWISGPTATNVLDQKGGRYDGTIYVDGDKTIDIAYWHP